MVDRQEGIPFSAIEEKWQRAWNEQGLYKTNLSRADRPFYTHAMFPYPSGDKLHIGHVYNYAPADTFARYMRMRGYDVFCPMGFDAFGLPAENHAIKTGVHPSVQIRLNVDTMIQQLKRLGCMYDWTKQLSTCDPAYYRWTQWVFALMFKRGLAYRKKSLVNFCPNCQTVLANEQVKGGRCERCSTLVVLEERLQWALRIRDYASRLLDNLPKIDWPEDSKKKQANWIRRSDGINFKMRVKGLDLTFEAFDSIPQTYLAQTYTVIAHDRPEVEQLVRRTEYETPVMEYVERVKAKRAKNPHALDKELDGIFTGRYADNPYGTGDFPIWIASYAKGDYGTGWINCSAHDERDFNFAKKYGIPLRTTMLPPDSDTARARRIEACEEFYGADNEKNPNGIIQQPEAVRGLRWDESREPVIRYIEGQGYGYRVEQFRLRDWGISRQRYWGAPIPVVYDPDNNPHLVPDEHLPWLLPTDVVEYKPKGTPPLGQSQELIERTERLFGRGWRPELDTMDTFVDSSFYSFRFLAENNADVFVPRDIERKWMPVGTYIGGAEHATKHLIYARFVTMVLFDAGEVSVEEPYKRLIHQGLIQGEKEFHYFCDPANPGRLISAQADAAGGAAGVRDVRDPRDLEDDEAETYGDVPDDVTLVAIERATSRVAFGMRVDKHKVTKTKGHYRLVDRPDVIVDARSFKMSKSRGNAISPEPMMDQYGVDTFRLFLVSLGPYSSSAEFDLEKIAGPARFVRRVWNYFHNSEKLAAAGDMPKIERAINLAVRNMTRQLAAFDFNTAVSALMVLINELEPAAVTRATAAKFVQLLAPLAPHVAEELWRECLGHSDSVFDSAWPECDESKLFEQTISVGVQVDGRARGNVLVPHDATDAEVERLAREAPEVQRHLANLTIQQVRVIPKRLINFTSVEATQAKEKAKATKA